MNLLNEITQYQGQVGQWLKDYQLIIGMLLLPIIYFIPRIATALFGIFKRATVLTLVIDESPNLSGEVFLHFSKWLSENRIKSFTRYFELDKNVNVRVGVGPNIFKFKGKYFLAYMTRREGKGFNDARMGSVQLMFFKWNMPIALEFTEFLKTYVDSDDTAQILRSDYGQWEVMGEIPKYIATQQQYINKAEYDLVYSIFDRIVNNPEYYLSRQMPLKETFLFYGPPRTGKTNLARHMSAHFNLDVMVVSPSKLHEMMFSRGRHRNGAKRLTVYLVEDIDSNQALCRDSATISSELDLTKLNDPERFNAPSALETISVSDIMVPKDDLSLFLNALDGVVPMNNAIVIFSTNFPHKLYKSIYGVGRVDHIVEISYMNFNEVIHLLGWGADDPRYIFMLTYEGRDSLPAKTIDMLRHTTNVSEIKDILHGRELAANLSTVHC